MTKDLATWLLEQIAEDERRAHDGESACAHLDLCDARGAEYYEVFGFELGPARVLVECDAKRQILALHAVQSGTGGDWDTDPPAKCNECGDLHPCDTVKLLVLPYADRPGCKAEWKARHADRSIPRVTPSR
jgi:hypothetical protein